MGFACNENEKPNPKVAKLSASASNSDWSIGISRAQHRLHVFASDCHWSVGISLALDFKMNLLEKVFDLVSASDRLYHIPMLCRLKICFFLVRCQLSPLSSFASQTETPSSFEVFLFLHLVCNLSGKINKTYFSSIYNSHLSFHPFSSSLIRSCDYAI